MFTSSTHQSRAWTYSPGRIKHNSRVDGHADDRWPRTGMHSVRFAMLALSFLFLANIAYAGKPPKPPTPPPADPPIYYSAHWIPSPAEGVQVVHDVNRQGIVVGGRSIDILGGTGSGAFIYLSQASGQRFFDLNEITDFPADWQLGMLWTVYRITDTNLLAIKTRNGDGVNAVVGTLTFESGLPRITQLRTIDVDPELTPIIYDLANDGTAVGSVANGLFIAKPDFPVEVIPWMSTEGIDPQGTKVAAVDDTHALHLYDIGGAMFAITDSDAISLSGKPDIAGDGSVFAGIKPKFNRAPVPSVYTAGHGWVPLTSEAVGVIREANATGMAVGEVWHRKSTGGFVFFGTLGHDVHGYWDLALLVADVPGWSNLDLTIRGMSDTDWGEYPLIVGQVDYDQDAFVLFPVQP